MISSKKIALYALLIGLYTGCTDEQNQTRLENQFKRSFIEQCLKKPAATAQKCDCIMTAMQNQMSLRDFVLAERDQAGHFNSLILKKSKYVIAQSVANCK